MKIQKLLNRLLTNCAVVAQQRHLPDVHDVLKAAAVLAGQEHLRDVEADLLKVVQDFEAKLVAGEAVTAEDLPNIPPPVEANPAETFEPLPDVTDEAPAEAAEAVVEEAPVVDEEEDFLDALEDDLDEETVTD